MSSSREMSDVHIEETMLPSLSDENCQASSRPASIEGRRIVDFQYIFDKFKELNNHNTNFQCNLNNMVIIKEIRKGLTSDMWLQCNMCNLKFKVPTNKVVPNMMGLNTSAVSGIISIGSGYAHLEELFSTINIPCMSVSTFNVLQNDVWSKWEETAISKMKEAGKREADYAREIGNVDEYGIPLITVVADGTWSKRSYRNNYRANSGCAAIIGQQFGQVLFLSVRNKYCSICLHATSKNEEPSVHHCYKNHTGSSTSMEANILVDGFQSSVTMHGVKYSKLIADGDSSTYKKILDARPYNNLTVEKIECRNHLLRNYCNKLRALSGDTSYPLQIRNLLSGKILRLRTAITSALAHRKKNINRTEAIHLLKNDIENSVCHVFGEHSNCADYFCIGSKATEKNEFTNLKSHSLFYSKIMNHVKYISNHSRSLIFDVDNNIVEQFNSIIAKFVGGKRINFIQRGSYQSRCHAAVVSFNTKSPHYEFHKYIYGRSPHSAVKKMEERRTQKSQQWRIRRQESKHGKKTYKPTTSEQNADYGEDCQKPDMPKDAFDIEAEVFLKQLEKSQEERENFEKETILQAGCGVWMEHRRKLLTASNFHNVCRKLPYTSCRVLVKKLLYHSDLSFVPSIAHGKENEQKALDKLSKQENILIEPCGMFLGQPPTPFLAATPDGIVGNHAVVEVKCPIGAFQMDPDEAIKMKKITFWKFNAQTATNIINKRHPYYYQIQGQLNITKRETCIFGVWTGDQHKMKVAYIEKDERFWKTEMEPKLIKFYQNCLLPELIDPRHTRNMTIRDPDYILAAQVENQKVKLQKKNNETKKKTSNLE